MYKMADWFNKAWEQFKEQYLISEEPCDSVEAFSKRISRDQTTFDTSRINPALGRGGELYDIIEGKSQGHFYERVGSAAKDALAHRLVLAEAGYLEEQGLNPQDHIGATTFPSGMSAITNVAEALVMLIPKEDRGGLKFLQGNNVYVHTDPLLGEVIPQKMGIESALKVDTTNIDEVRAALEENNGKIIAIYYEPITNPLLEHTDTREIYKLAKEHNVPIVTDNTFLTPFLYQPLRDGADIIIHSMTKYMNGEGDALGGAVIGPVDFIKSLKRLQEVTGAVLPNSQLAQLFYDRIPNLPDNMKRHIDNAIVIYDFLSQHPNVDSATYIPEELPHTRGCVPGAVLNFTLKGSNDEERLANVVALEDYIIANPGVIENRVSLGERDHLLIGERYYSPGFVRFAVGREPGAMKVIRYLNKAFDHVYQKK